MHERLDEVKAIIAGTRGARDVDIYRAGTRAAHRRRRRSRRRRRATASRCATSRTRSRARYGGKLATAMWEGERKVGVRDQDCRSPSEGDTGVGRRGWRSRPSDARACRSRRWRSCTSTAGARRSTASRASGSWPSSATSGPRHGQLRRRGAGARREARCKLPEGYHLTWGGEFENQRRAMKRLAVIVPISVLVIFFLLYMTFRAALPALVVLLDVPFATVGGVFALYVTGTELSVSSAVGFITLFGVSVMNGVLIVNYMRRARANPSATPETRARARSRAASAAGADDRAAGVDRPPARGAVAQHRVGHAAAVRDRDRRGLAARDAAHHVPAARPPTSSPSAGSAAGARHPAEAPEEP